MRDMLRAMGQGATASNQSVSNETSFAALLASFTAVSKANATPDWKDDGLADDVAVLSYEGALKRQAVNSPASAVAAPVRAAEGGRKPPMPEGNLDWKKSRGPTPSRTLTITEVDGPKAARVANNLKQASVTLRMSKAECAQLRERAAESGMNVSAYVRSCTFEAEALRSQVKDALAQLRGAPVDNMRAKEAPQREGPEPAVPQREIVERQPQWGWLRRFMPSPLAGNSAKREATA